jgi:hypothetical protein
MNHKLLCLKKVLYLKAVPQNWHLVGVDPPAMDSSQSLLLLCFEKAPFSFKTSGPENHIVCLLLKQLLDIGSWLKQTHQPLILLRFFPNPPL